MIQFLKQNFYIKNLLILLGVCLVAVFVWEHNCRLYNINVRPSVALNWISHKIEVFFQTVGSIFAHISSFINYIKIRELVITFYDLVHPFISILTSPIYMVFGYLEEAHEYKYPIMITVGSILLVLLGVVIYYRYRTKINSWISTCYSTCYGTCYKICRKN